MFILLFLFFMAIFGWITGTVAKNRGQEFAPWFIFGALLFIVALFLKPPGRKQSRRSCPYCGADVGSEMRCPSCGRGQPNIGAATVNSWETTVSKADGVDRWIQQQNRPPTN
jgi:hypothetical protein